MNRRTFLLSCAAAPFLPALIGFAQDDATPTGYLETHRLRVVNRELGAVSVSIDTGKTWQLIGRVIYPATTVTQGYIAAEYAGPGTVAATAIHGHRLRVSGDDKSLRVPAIVSLSPREYLGKPTNKGYGGHRPGGGGAYTNIAAGVSLFRELAPHVGNPVLMESAGGNLSPLSLPFIPLGTGETLVIPVRVPVDSLVEVVFPNVAGGTVVGTFASGIKRDLTQVIQPVAGVGRFDGTAFTGVGRLNTAHTGVLTVCTAPVDGDVREGEGVERRGGFQISPVWHNSRCEEAGAPMVLILGAVGVPRQKDREGTAPLFRDAVSLGEVGVVSVDVAIDGGDWEPMPQIVGLHLDAFTGTGLTKVWKEAGIKRVAKQGITAFRMRLPELSRPRMVALATTGATRYVASQRQAAKRGDLALVSGTVTVQANAAANSAVSWARLIVEGKPQGFTNVAPFTFSWDTRRTPDGEYLLQTETLDASGATLSLTEKRVFVSNT